MTGQYREEYREPYRKQYREEMAQIHAPLDLIEKTKAAVRVEEKRLLQERVEITEPKKSHLSQEEYKESCERPFTRRWTYPLTAAAALLILISVSLAMRGMKGSGSGMDGAVNEESADAGFAEDAVMESAMEEDMPVGSAGAQDMAVESAAGQDMAVESAAGQDMAVESAAGQEAAVESAGTQDAAAGLWADEAGTPAESAAGAAESAEPEEAALLNNAECSTEETGQSMSAADDVARDIEDAGAVKESMEQKQESTAGSFADSAADGIVVEKAEKKPAFCDLPDTKAHTYEGKTFLVRKEKNGWEAYVETENGGGYVLRGEAEDLEEFLEAGYEKLADKW